VRWVQIDLDADDHDHLITPEERLRVAHGQTVGGARGHGFRTPAMGVSPGRGRRQPAPDRPGIPRTRSALSGQSRP
jgi:hypothetical protein